MLYLVTNRAQQGGFCFDIRQVRIGYWKKSRGADRLKSVRSVVIFVRVFMGMSGTYTRCSGLPEMWVTRHQMIFKTELGRISFRKNCRVSGTHWALVQITVYTYDNQSSHVQASFSLFCSCLVVGVLLVTWSAHLMIDQPR